MQENRPLQRVERHVSPAENCSSDRGALRKNTLKDTPLKKSLQNKRDRSSAQKIDITDIDDLEVATPTEKRARTELSTRLSKIMTRGAKKSSNGSRLLQGSETSTVSFLLQRML